MADPVQRIVDALAPHLPQCWQVQHHRCFHRWHGEAQKFVVWDGRHQWEGATPDEVIDKVLTQAKEPG